MDDAKEMTLSEAKDAIDRLYKELLCDVAAEPLDSFACVHFRIALSCMSQAREQLELAAMLQARAIADHQSRAKGCGPRRQH